MSTKYVDFAQIKSSVSVASVIPVLNLTMRQNGAQFRGPCPACKAGGDRALAINADKAGYYCFAQKKGGDVIALAAHIKDLSTKDAASFLADHFGNGPQSTVHSPVPNTSSRPQQATERKTFDPAAYAATLDLAHEALLPLGISADVLKSFSAGYCGTGINRGRLAVGLRVQGNLSAFMGIALKGEQPRIIFPKEFDPRQVIFGIERVSQPEVRLVKDPLQVMASAEYGEEAICFLTDLIDPTQDELLAAAKHEKHFNTFWE